MPVIVHDHLPFLQLRWTRMIWDFGCILVGFVLGGKLGIGTIIALTLYGPGLQFFLPVANRLARIVGLPQSNME